MLIVLSPSGANGITRLCDGTYTYCNTGVRCYGVVAPSFRDKDSAKQLVNDIGVLSDQSFIDIEQGFARPVADMVNNALPPMHSDDGAGSGEPARLAESTGTRRAS